MNMDIGPTEKGLLFILVAVMSCFATLIKGCAPAESDLTRFIINRAMFVFFLILTVAAALNAVIMLWPP